ncbi:hypothetical protein Val02_03800 [Virgisporangium aliadipatigenens]|uniref:Uncharacterized protein n=1 Tax=Virgisporangium aliadipatigenens TaxID=741659 RepID=A0A8J4DMK8_9ACTN|nr:hypothetical protein [Virgisporangium aliadipatigenens]GIJ43494.1 hypothetical protein Val02_03800 [Virgisporangium aliadipatigenens]
MTDACATCGAPVRPVVSERAEPRLNRTAWAVETRCGACGAAEVVDGWGEPPEDVRAALVARDGLTRLTVDPATATKLRTVQALRHVAATSIPEALARHEELITTGLTGRPAPMELLADLLRDAGVAVVVRP